MSTRLQHQYRQWFGPERRQVAVYSQVVAALSIERLVDRPPAAVGDNPLHESP